MLIQCDYKSGDYLVRNSTIYYQGVRVSPFNPLPLWVVGAEELYLFPAISPLKCAWLVVVQSRDPVFYECTKVEMEGEKMSIHLTNGKQLRIKPFCSGVCDRFLINEIVIVR